VVLGLAVYRVYEDTFNGTRFYVDDLITDERNRSKGVGHLLMDYLKQQTRLRKVNRVTLESGTQRQQAHRFYFREGFIIPSFSFAAEVNEDKKKINGFG